MASLDRDAAAAPLEPPHRAASARERREGARPRGARTLLAPPPAQPRRRSRGGAWPSWAGASRWPPLGTSRCCSRVRIAALADSM
eukprot:7379753-Prymnesium_polylepis.1